MKADTQLRKEILEAFKGEPGFAGTKIRVSVRNGAITLSGRVPTHTEKYAFERAVLRVPGVQVVAEGIQVDRPAPHLRADEEVAALLARTLCSPPQGWADFQAIVEDGWVTLQGEATSVSQRDALVKAVQGLAGIKGIYNLITLAAADQPALKGTLERLPQRTAQAAELGGDNDEAAAFLPL